MGKTSADAQFTTQRDDEARELVCGQGQEHVPAALRIRGSGGGCEGRRDVPAAGADAGAGCVPLRAAGPVCGRTRGTGAAQGVDVFPRLRRAVYGGDRELWVGPGVGGVHQLSLPHAATGADERIWPGAGVSKVLHRPGFAAMEWDSGCTYRRDREGTTVCVE